MRQVNRGVPAAQTYPPNYAGLSLEQRQYVEFWYAMLFETKTAQCAQWAQQLETVYDIDYESARASIGTGLHGSWTTVVELNNVFNQVQAAFNARPNPPDPNDPAEVRNMTRLYARLKGVAVQKPAIWEYYKGKVGENYSKARRQLILNIGQYCSYCELPLAASLAVEHMLPKSDFPLRGLLWDNFLLACPICNSYKSNQPTRAQGIALSPNLGAHMPPAAPASPPTVQEEQWIVDAAAATYLWPSDAANYTAFQNFFQYQLWQVIYDAAGNLVAEGAINNNDLTAWVREDRIKFVSDSGNAVIASVGEPLHEFLSFDSGEIITAWQAGNIDARLLGKLQANRLVLDPAANTTGKVVKQTVNADNFKVIEKRKYYVDLAGSPTADINVPVWEIDPTDVNNTLVRRLFTLALSKQDQALFRQRLASGLLPDQIETEFNKPAYKVDKMKDTITMERGRTEVYITVQKTYPLYNDAGFLQLFGAYNMQVELRLAASVTALAAQAGQVITDLRLNNVNAALQGNKLTDRRMIKRTRTYFVAVETVRRLFMIMPQTGPVQPYDELLSMVAETAKATGFWSVWWTVLHSSFSDQGMRDGVMQFLTDQNNFPGTR